LIALALAVEVLLGLAPINPRIEAKLYKIEG
jgi:hypothetical protein